MPMVAWQVLSKLSYMNLKEYTLYYDLFRKYNFFYRQYLVIRLVLPTLCSPRKTNLNFLKIIFSFDLRKCCRLSYVYELSAILRHLFVIQGLTSTIQLAHLRGFPKSPEVDILRPVSAKGSARENSGEDPQILLNTIFDSLVYLNRSLTGRKHSISGHPAIICLNSNILVEVGFSHGYELQLTAEGAENLQIKHSQFLTQFNFTCVGLRRQTGFSFSCAPVGCRR